MDRDLMRHTSFLRDQIEEIKTQPINLCMILSLLTLNEKVKRHIKQLESLYSNMPDFHAPTELLDSIEGFAPHAYTFYMTDSETKLKQEAEDAIEKDDEVSFCKAVHDLRRVFEGGKCAADANWISHYNLPWHLYNDIEELADRFIDRNGKYDKIQECFRW